MARAPSSASAGELEHGALWHVPGGYAMRELLGGAKAIVPSAKKVGGLGARLDVPITHKDASYVRSHFDAIEVGIADAPRANEIVLVLAMTTGPRVHARVGGLAVSEIKGEDGLQMSASIRKIITVVEETLIEGGRAVSPPTRRAAAIAVIENPLAGRYVENLDPLIAVGEELGGLLAERAVAALGIRRQRRRELWQGGLRRRGGRAGACRGDPASEARRAVPQGARQGRRAHSVLEEAGGTGRAVRHPARPQGCGLRAQPFRRHGGARR